jgi:DNA-binding IscR family transcriptional regulator
MWAVAILKCLERLHEELGNNEPISKRKISAEIGISTDYIEQIVVPMKNAGYVSSIRGLRGGFILVAEQLSMGQVRDVMEPKPIKKFFPERTQKILDYYTEQIKFIDAEIMVLSK